jgi:hypothetical protein
MKREIRGLCSLQMLNVDGMYSSERALRRLLAGKADGGQRRSSEDHPTFYCKLNIGLKYVFHYFFRNRL